MTRIFVLFFTLLFSLSSFAQQEDEKYIKNKTLRAIVQIRRLKQGALLVRLYEKENQIALLEKQGKYASVIQSYKDKIAKENNEIVDAFKNQFTFCPVYFFYSKDSEHIKNRDFKQVQLMNNNGEPSDKGFSDQYFYTADLSELRVDTISYITSHTTRDENDNFTIAKGKKTRVSYEAIMIRSDEFVDLLTPFPYSTRTYKDLPLFRRTIARTINKLNFRLEHFYRKFENLEIDPKTNKVINR